MSKLVNYLEQEGLVTTIRRVLDKIIYKKVSYTVFLRAVSIDKPLEQMTEEIEILSNENRNSFEAIKFWDFVKTDEFIRNDHQSIVLLKKGNDYIAYAAEEHGVNRNIHGLGCFTLSTDEGWIGPVFVSKMWRGKGYNRQLLLQQIHRLSQLGVNTIYTAVNSQNAASIKSFLSVGFEEIGTVDRNGIIVTDTEDILRKAFRKLEGI